MDPADTGGHNHGSEPSWLLRDRRTAVSIGVEDDVMVGRSVRFR